MNAVYQELGPCPCRDPACTAIGTKLSRKTGHLVDCNCPPCRGLAANRGGHRKQDRILVDAAKAEGRRRFRAPTNEEDANLLVHYESKSGTSLPRAFTGDTIRHHETQARSRAHRHVPHRKWALVYTMDSGERRIWMDFDEFLTLVSEIHDEAAS